MLIGALVGQLAGNVAIGLTIGFIAGAVGGLIAGWRIGGRIEHDLDVRTTGTRETSAFLCGWRRAEVDVEDDDLAEARAISLETVAAGRSRDWTIPRSPLTWRGCAVALNISLLDWRAIWAI